MIVVMNFTNIEIPFNLLREGSSIGKMKIENHDGKFTVDAEHLYLDLLTANNKISHRVE